MNEVTTAANAAISTGDRTASQFLLRLLSRSLESGFRNCLICATLFELTSQADWSKRDAVMVHFLAATLSSFFRRRAPQLLRSRSEQERRRILSELHAHFIPPMTELLLRAGSAEGKLSRRLRRGLGDCIAMAMLFVTHDIVAWVHTHSVHLQPDAQRAQVVLDVILAAMGVVADVTVNLGPVTRSANRLAIQKQLDTLLILPYGGHMDSSEAAAAVQQAAEFLCNYSTLLPQEQCPRFYEVLPASTLWQGVLDGLQRGEEGPIDAATSALNSISVIDSAEALAIVLGALQAVHRSGSQPSISKVMHAVLEGPLGDVLLAPEASDVRQMVEQYFCDLASALQTPTMDASLRRQWTGVLQEGVLLLLGSLRPQDVPTMEEDDDEDDFATVVEEILASNGRKQQCVMRLQSFLEWTCDFISQSVSTCDEQGYAQLLDTWLEKDEEQWLYDTDFPCGVVQSVVCLERLVSLAPWCASRLSDSIASSGAAASVRLYNTIVANGRPSVEDGGWDTCAAGVAWYVARLICRGVLEPDAITNLIQGVLLAGVDPKAAIALLRACGRIPSAVLPVALIEQVWRQTTGNNTINDPVNIRMLLAAMETVQRQNQLLGSLSTLQLLWDGAHTAHCPIDVQLGAIACAWASEDVFPHQAALLALSVVMGALNATSVHSSIQHQQHIPEASWRMLAANMERYLPQCTADVHALGQALLAVTARASGVYVSECTGIALSFCTSRCVKGSVVHVAIGEAWLTIATELTSQQPIPFVDLSSIVGAAALFECNLTDWYLSLVSWSLREPQARTLYAGAAVGLVQAAARGCCALLADDAVPSPQERAANWFRAVDAVVTFLVCVLGADWVDDADAADVGGIVQECGELLWRVACRFAGAGVMQSQDARALMDPVTLDALQHTGDAFEASSRLKALMSHCGTE